MRLPFRLLSKRLATTMLVAIALVSGALAYFTTIGSGNASGSVTTLSAPASPAASASGTTATITWNASTIGGTVAASSYTVERYSSTGTDLGAASCSPVASSSGNPNAFGSFTCSDSPGGGSFKYTITAKYHASWTATTAFTSTVSVQSSTSMSASGPGTGTTNSAIAASSISGTLSGAGTGATGTITFKVFGPQASAPSTCTSGGTTVGTATVSGNATYHPSAGYTPTSAGTYWWYASYGGDSGNTASASTCGSGMSSTVVQNAPAATASAPATGNAGGAIAASSISSVLSGASAGATGTITFKVFGPQASAPTTCTSGGTTVGTATVSGNATYNPSAGYTPSTVGTYWWYASYNGDSNNSAATSTCGSGMASTVVSAANDGVTVGAPATDDTSVAIGSGSISATLSSGSSPSGTITFTVFGPQASAPTTCTSGGTTVGTATVSGNGTYNPSAGYTPTAVGTYWWYVSYGGDSNNAAASSTCGSGMTSTVVKNLTIATAAAPATDTSGTAIAASSISSTLSGGTAGAGGTITFKVFGPQTTAPSSCTSGGTTVGTATVSGNATYHPSAGFTPSSAGVYWWYVSYSGDSSNDSATSTCSSAMASTYVWTVSSAANATTTSGSSITTSSFTVQASTTYLLLVGRHSVAGDGITSISSTSLSPALTLSSFTSITSQTFGSGVDYQWAYWITTGSSASGTGTITINFTKTLAGGQISMVDLVALDGNNTTNPIVVGNEALTTGTNNSTATANLASAPSSVDASLDFVTTEKNMPATAPAGTPAITNIDYAQAGAGSIGVFRAVPGSQNESFAISTAQNWGSIALELRRAGSVNTTTTTATGPATGSAGTAIAAGSISSTLSGAAAGAGGAITFTVFGPQATAPTTCTSGGTTVGTATVSGNGTVNPSAGYTPATTGTYWWYASYGGDGGDLESNSTCGSGMSSTVVGNGNPTLTASAPSAALTGAAISASSITSTLSSGASPTGTITYTVFGPQATAPTNCTTGGTTVGTSTVSGNGSYSSSASFTPISVGTYWWYASYGGDSNNNSATSTCGSAMPSTYVYSASSVASVNDTAQTNNSTTSSFTVQPSTTYLLLVFRKSAAGDGVASLSSTGLSPSLSLSSFTSITSQNYNVKDYQWAYWITTASNASGTGTIKITFTNTLGAGSGTIIDVVQLGGVSGTAPIVTGNEVTSNANSATATANLPSAPSSGDLGFVFLSSDAGLGATAPTASPAMTNVFYQQSGSGTLAPYVAAASQNESFTFGAHWWGTIGLELTHS